MKRTYLFLVLLLWLGATARAQPGQYELRLTTQSIDCATRKAQVNVQIRAADQQAFYLGNANFRLRYDTRALAHPVLLNQLNMHARQGDDAHTLTGSVERGIAGIASLNIFYGGTNAVMQRIDNEWTGVAMLQFDLVNRTSDMVALAWQTDKDFPKTVLEEILPAASGNDYTARSARSAGVYHNLNLGPLSAVCPNESANRPATDVLFVPEGFSPNGDGINDRFEIKNLGGLSARVTVYNRQGTVVFTDDAYKNTWDGTLANGQPTPDGTYYYAIDLSDGRWFVQYMTIAR